MSWLLYLLAILLHLETDPDPDDDEPDDEPVEDDADDDEPDPAEKTRDPKKRIESLLDANRRLAAKVKKLESGTSNGGAVLAEAKLENAFLRAAIARGAERGVDIDLDTLHTLMTSKGLLDAVTIDDETGEPDLESMGEAIERTVQRYPWIEDGDSTHVEPEPRPKVSTPKTGTGRRQKDKGELDAALIRERFPSLKRRRAV